MLDQQVVLGKGQVDFCSEVLGSGEMVKDCIRIFTDDKII